MRANFLCYAQKINIRHYHMFVCPVYVLDARLQGASFIPKWDKLVRVGTYIRRSPNHAGNVSLIINISSGHISPQFHVVFRQNFFKCSITKKTDQFHILGSSYAKIIENLLYTNISFWQIYGENLIRKVASNLTSKGTQLTKKFNNQKMMH